MSEMIPTLETPDFDIRRETRIDYTESLGDSYKSITIEKHLMTHGELIALIRELRGDKRWPTT